MLTSLSSNAIGAKAKAIYGKRITTANYHELLRQRTVSDVAAYLKNNTNYAELLSGINETSIHRGQLEVLLHRARLNKYLSLCHYDFDRKNRFFHFVIIDTEISIILRSIMLLNSNSMDEIITNVPVFMQEYVCFDFMKLSKIKNYQDLLTVLSATSYKNVLKNFNAENGNIDISGCEYALKCFYYTNILNSVDRNYKGTTRQELRKLILIEAELINISLIYRLKTYFKRSPSQIKNKLLPFYYKLNPSAINALLQTQSEQEFRKRIKLSSYSKKMEYVHSNYLENHTKHLMFIISHTLMRFSTNAPVAFYCLMTLSQIELENIVTIIEGIRYNNLPSEIEKLLILE